MNIASMQFVIDCLSWVFLNRIMLIFRLTWHTDQRARGPGGGKNQLGILMSNLWVKKKTPRAAETVKSSVFDPGGQLGSGLGSTVIW